MNIPEPTLYQQYASSNPENSAWVSANAGSGKTHVLTQRVIRLMLAGNSPDKILCLTFTKAAAANMKNRVFGTLAEWAMMSDENLDREIENTSNSRSNLKLRNRARQLFALALDTPGGLKIQTIHAFCESLLHQFPLEANVPGHFDALQEIEQVNMLEAARREVLSKNIDGAADHYAALIPFATDHTIEEGLGAIIHARQDFSQWIDGGVEAALEPLYEKLGISKSDTPRSIKHTAIDDILADRDLISSICVQATLSNKKTDTELATSLQTIMEKQDSEFAFEALRKVFLTVKNEPKTETRIATKFVKDAIPDAIDVLLAISHKIVSALEKINAVELLKSSFHLFKIGDLVLQRYESMKRQRGVIDFDDQIEKSANLLTRAEIRDWIRYRLDRGIDHLLVDEAQDTSPKQWQIINAITEDFHAGETARSTNRTVFVVGDEKQSIFSFQGAEPSEFDQQEKELKKRVSRAQRNYHAGRLELSFRSTQDVLHAVDAVFAIEENAHGLTQSGNRPVHDAVRTAEPGEVQIWPLFKQEQPQQTESWLDPVDKDGSGDPALQLAEKIADTIGEWVGKPLPGMSEPLKFGDILVLVRKRDKFLTAFTRTMKDKGLSIAGADRLILTDHIAVEDLIAIGRVVLLPEDDLSLACVLKSVFFNIDEETLFHLAHNRDGASLYQHVKMISNDDNHAQSAVAQEIIESLDAIISFGCSARVFDFYAHLLGKMGGRKKILARLGLEAEDVLDAFLDEALSFTNDRNGGLETFITELTNAEPEIKREVELERDEVRVLTVHSSKGLEAKAVFLVDHCGPAWTEKHRPPLLEIDTDKGASAYLWLANSGQHVTATRNSVKRVGEAAEAEYRRLLYVGMTRAADRLVVCGFHGLREPAHPYWHQMVKDALIETSVEIYNKNGELDYWKWVSKEQPPLKPKPTQEKGEGVCEKAEMPKWLFEQARTDPPLPRPLTPSGAHALIDRENLNEEALQFEDNGEYNSHALKKGNAMHKLLEVLPDITVENREQLAQQYLLQTCSEWTDAQRQNVLTSVFRIFSNPSFGHLFEGRAKAEVSVAGRLDVKSGSMLVTGQIDRLVVGDNQVTILDYKTNRLVPETIDKIPHEYITQLALYRELVNRIYDDKTVVSALLWTQTPEVMVIHDDMLDSALDKIVNS